MNYYQDDVPAVGPAPRTTGVRWQHMTTFSIALGVSGTLQYRPDYKTATTGDFADIRTGAQNWPLWPNPAPTTPIRPTTNDPRSIDDFWHTAVNGRGMYFSANNPTGGDRRAAPARWPGSPRCWRPRARRQATSNLEPVSGDNFVYLASYTTRTGPATSQAQEINSAPAPSSRSDDLVGPGAARRRPRRRVRRPQDHAVPPGRDRQPGELHLEHAGAATSPATRRAPPTPASTRGAGPLRRHQRRRC